ncbi:hypothetical protein NDG35_002021 [Salmonella enterica]|nr:hypothetical protein [Salmonella enterica]
MPSSSFYVLRVINAAKKNRLTELKNVLLELDLAIRVRKISQQQKKRIIHEIKKNIEHEQGILLDENSDLLDVITRGENYTSNDDLVDLIAMLSRGRYQ